MNAGRPLIVGNWKFNGLAAQLNEIASISASVYAKPFVADVLIFVPATPLSQVAC
ncbi:hypothetical protein G3T14_21470 [Methylobacterium sp. BTF04]|uniref:triose-phosphate isomerase n=1 Tax=Methylobacterium sp. BTF04 TaxID=2708300 RepID=UPI0013D2398C|nr:triose-phosphate isomerase [Methylobacterium sp. BTF04]NEU14657.1 hypothetical protein [Methylobacterium sp. BTF04]